MLIEHFAAWATCSPSLQFSCLSPGQTLRDGANCDATGASGPVSNTPTAASAGYWHFSAAYAGSLLSSRALYFSTARRCAFGPPFIICRVNGWNGQAQAVERAGNGVPTLHSFQSANLTPPPSPRTTGLPGPVQPECHPPNGWVFVGFGRVLPAGWPQYRHGSTPLTSDKGVDTTGRESRLSGQPDCRK